MLVGIYVICVGIVIVIYVGMSCLLHLSIWHLKLPDSVMVYFTVATWMTSTFHKLATVWWPEYLNAIVLATPYINMCVQL